MIIILEFILQKFTNLHIHGCVIYSAYKKISNGVGTEYQLVLFCVICKKMWKIDFI